MVRLQQVGAALFLFWSTTTQAKVEPEHIVHCEADGPPATVVDVDLYVTGHPMGGPAGLYSGIMRVRQAELAEAQGYVAVDSFLVGARYGYRGSNWVYDWELEVERTADPFEGLLRYRMTGLSAWTTVPVQCERHADLVDTPEG